MCVCAGGVVFSPLQPVLTLVTDASVLGVGSAGFPAGAWFVVYTGFNSAYK